MPVSWATVSDDPSPPLSGPVETIFFVEETIVFHIMQQRRKTRCDAVIEWQTNAIMTDWLSDLHFITVSSSRIQ